MAKRIPKPFIDELTARTDLLALLSSRITFTKKSGSNHWACGPFHDEKTPSFSVNTQKGFYHCFGCGVSGDGIRFLMDYIRKHDFKPFGMYRIVLGFAVILYFALLH